jgi:hypothetical protein
VKFLRVSATSLIAFDIFCRVLSFAMKARYARGVFAAIKIIIDDKYVLPILVVRYIDIAKATKNMNMKIKRRLLRLLLSVLIGFRYFTVASIV